jgi:PAS domain S-box-containing protein
MIAQILKKLRTINPWHFLWIVILIAEALTLILNSLQSFMRWGYISRELIEIGVIDAFIVSLIAAPIAIYSLNAYNEKLKQDLAERREAEERLRKSEDKLRAYLDNISDTILLIDANLNMVYVSPSVKRMLDISPEELIGNPSSLVIYPDDMDIVTGAQRYVLEHPGEPHTVQYRVCNRDGCRIHVESTGINMMDNPAINGVLVTMRDISERKQTEEAKDRLLTAISVVTEGIAITDDKDRFIYLNDAHARIFGCLQAELIGKTWRDTVPSELVPLIERDLSITLHDRAVGIWRGECPALRKDGTILPTEITATSRWDEAGNYLGHICIVRDITERKRTEEALINSEQFTRKILDTVDEGFIVIDRDFRIRTANKAYCIQVGEPCDSVIGRHCYEVSHKTLRPCYEEGEECAVRHVFATGEPHTALHRHPDAKGSILYVETKAFPIKDSTGAVTSVIETINNITEKHLLEEEQLKTQKLEAIGTLAGGIAHDFNNLLQGVFGYISLAKTVHDDKVRSLAMLEQAEKALHMSVNLTTQLLTFAKGGKPVKKKISLQPVIENSVRFALSGSSVDYRTLLDSDLWAVEADEGQIGQVIQNIVLNADQATPSGGMIMISAKNLLSPGKRLPHFLGEGKYVQISIQDSGIGIPEKYLQKIFDPYFTTKEKGSGLGLATSYSIIRNHGGLIEVASEIGKGTTFFVYLPAIAAERKTSAAIAASPVVRKGKILFMDDEEMMRNIAGEMLMALGHEVELTEEGEDAIEKYQSASESGRPFDIVILDLTVRGGMGGRETIERLLDFDPAVSAIVSSGYSDDAVVSDYNKFGFKARLTKPYRLEELRNTLNALLSW